MDCPSCGAANAPGHQFCSACGTALSIPCARCSFANPAGAKFCGKCGAPLAGAGAQTAPDQTEGGERRQVAVLFADLCEFTRLSSELDVEEVHQLLGRFFEAADGVVERFGGTIDKHIGDAVMAIFGAPVAHGNDPQRAARAAIDIHAAVSRLNERTTHPVKVHIGIASGEVVAGGTGSSRHSQYTVTGEAVNLASRLNDLAAPGATLVSEAIYQALDNQFAAEAVGETTIAGLPHPVHVWRISGFGRVAPGRAAITLVGRRNELRQFSGILQTCQEDNRGQIVYLRGEAGIGKTRLAEEFAAIAHKTGFATHKGLVLDFGVGHGQDAIRAIIRSLLGLSLEDDSEAREAAANSTISSRVIVPEAGVFLYDLLDLQQPAEFRSIYEAMDNTARNRGKQGVATSLLRTIANRQPVVVIVEDIHWAGPITLQYLAAFCAVVATHPAVLLLTSRIEGDPLDQAWRSVVRNCPLSTIDLAPLRPEEAAAMASGFVAVMSDMATQCIERAEGNPLFLEQLLRGAEDYAAGAVPASIQSLVLARMDRLAASDRRVLQAASVIGQRFSLDVVCALLEQPKNDLSPLIQAYLIRPEGAEFLFAHALIRDGVYGSLLKTTQRQLHRRAALWFESRDPALAAEHLDRADDPGAPQAYLAAAKAQAAGYHYERAVELARRGGSLAVAPADAFELTLLEAGLLLDLGSVSESVVSFQKSVGFAPDDAARCRAMVGLAGALRVMDRHEAALAELAAAEPLANAHGLLRERAEIHHLRGNLYFPLSNMDGCLREHELALSDARQIGWEEGVARAFGGLGDAQYLRGRMRTANGHFQRCVSISHDRGFVRAEVSYRHMIGWTALYLQPLAQAEAEGIATAEMAARVSHHRAELLGIMLVAQTRTERGDVQGAEEPSKRGLELAGRLGARNFRAHLHGLSARLLAARGRVSEAVAEVRTALAIVRQTGMGYLGPTILGVLALITDSREERHKCLEEGVAILSNGAVGHNYFWFYRSAIQAALADSDWVSAIRYADALEDYVRDEPLPWSDCLCAQARVLAEAAKGRGDAGLEAEVHRVQAQAEQLDMGVRLPMAQPAAPRG